MANGPVREGIKFWTMANDQGQWREDFNSACRKNFKRLTVEELLAVGAWSDFMARGGPDPRVH